MRVLIVLAFIGVAYAGEAILAPAPLAYSSLIVDEPKPSYEYSTSVQTPTYNNYAHVRSGGNLERKIYNFAAPIAAAAAPIAAEPILAEAKFIQPAIAQPILKAAAFSEYRSEIPLAAPAIALPTTKLLPIAYEPKPLYRFAAPAPTLLAAAAPAAAQILTVENKLIGEGKSQYHSQNELGEATYGHRELLQQHDAVQDAQGNKAGSFSYVAPDGRLLTTDYIADQAGYRVASNAFPNAPNAPAALPAAATVAAIAQPIGVAALEKPAEIGESEIIVEAKSRNRRSVAFAAAPAIAAPALRAAPLYTSRPLLYTNPYAYSSSSYAYSAPLSYSYAPSAYSYSPYAYSYPTYPTYPSLYYKSLAFRK